MDTPNASGITSAELTALLLQVYTGGVLDAAGAESEQTINFSILSPEQFVALDQAYQMAYESALRVDATFLN